jgi:predicted ATPase
MELLERKSELSKLSLLWANATRGMGKTVLITGEAGVGRSSFLQSFSEQVKGVGTHFLGCCEPLFSPRPLGPLHDIAPRLGKSFTHCIRDQENHSIIFSSLMDELIRIGKPICLVFEDVQWADSGTLDLIQYLGRKIEGLPILLLVLFHESIPKKSNCNRYREKQFLTSLKSTLFVQIFYTISLLGTRFISMKFCARQAIPYPKR